jgi:hypothetical protein
MKNCEVNKNNHGECCDFVAGVNEITFIIVLYTVGHFERKDTPL